MIANKAAEYMGIFFDAIETGTAETVCVLLAEHPRLIKCQNEKQESALFIACQVGNPEVVSILLRHNADSSEADIYDTSCLHVCATPAVAEVLLSEGADVDAANKLGLTPLHYHVLHNNLDMVKVLLANGSDCTIAEHGMGATPLHYAADKANFLLLSALIEGNPVNIDTNMRDNDGDTALHKVASYNG